LQADPDDSITHGACLDLSEHPIFFTATIPEKEEAKSRILPRRPFKSFDERMVTFQSREPRHFADPETFRIEAESLPVSGAFAPRKGMKTPPVDPIAQSELAAMSKAKRLKLFELLSGDGENAGSKSIEQFSLEKTSWRKFVPVENDVLGMDDERTRGGRPQASEPRVDESAEVMGVDEVKVPLSDQVPQSLDRARRKSGRFPERDEPDPLVKPFGKGAGSAQAAYGHVEALRIEAV
jgi:hypothetical protein